MAMVFEGVKTEGRCLRVVFEKSANSGSKRGCCKSHFLMTFGSRNFDYSFELFKA